MEPKVEYEKGKVFASRDRNGIAMVKNFLCLSPLTLACVECVEDVYTPNPDFGVDIITYDDCKIKIWNIETGEILKTISFGTNDEADIAKVSPVQFLLRLNSRNVDTIILYSSSFPFGELKRYSIEQKSRNFVPINENYLLNRPSIGMSMSDDNNEISVFSLFDGKLIVGEDNSPKTYSEISTFPILFHPSKVHTNCVYMMLVTEEAQNNENDEEDGAEYSLKMRLINCENVELVRKVSVPSVKKTGVVLLIDSFEDKYSREILVFYEKNIEEESFESVIFVNSVNEEVIYSSKFPVVEDQFQLLEFLGPHIITSSSTGKWVSIFKLGSVSNGKLGETGRITARGKISRRFKIDFSKKKCGCKEVVVMKYDKRSIRLAFCFPNYVMIGRLGNLESSSSLSFPFLMDQEENDVRRRIICLRENVEEVFGTPLFEGLKDQNVVLTISIFGKQKNIVVLKSLL